MTIQEQARFYTLADLADLPNDDGKRYELSQGELIEMNPPNWGHTLLSMKLIARLTLYLESNNVGQLGGAGAGYVLHTDLEMGRQTMRIPDISFVGKAKLNAPLNQVFVGAPDLAIEIISPSETYTMIRKKLRDFFNYGVQVVWLVYAEARQIEVYPSLEAEPTVLDVKATLEGGSLLPGFSFKVSDLVAVLDRQK